MGQVMERDCEGADKCEAEPCSEKTREKQRKREETEELVRENGIRLAMNQHICED